MPTPVIRLLPFILFLAGFSIAQGESEVSFSREVLPILSDRCFHCHGPDESHRKADLRLDLETEAKQGGVIVPGDLTQSELWYRITTDDADDLMPPADSHRKPLTADEQQTLQKWIEQGAPWGKHWAFESVERPELPDAEAHPVDAFVRAQLQRESLDLSLPAPTHVQLRRLSLALTGLPSTPEEVAAFAKDPSDAAYAAAVDHYLASPHHGERLAMWWLDAARYSDTDGYQQDAERNNWPWRDWVIQAFNDNMPFDQFTIEQFAGDLLPDATAEQILATCFHRNHMTNGEGGRLPEESRIDYVIDRVNTTGTVWLGLTLGCAQCHTHKFDPVSHEDYYRMFAFFNSVAEDGKAGKNAKPYMKYRSPLAERAVEEMEQHIASLEPFEAAARKTAESGFENWLRDQLTSLPDDYQAWRPMIPANVRSMEGTILQVEKDGTVQATGPNPRQDDYKVTLAAPNNLERITGWKLEVFPYASHTEGKLSRGKTGEFILTNVKLLVQRKGASQVRDIEMAGAIADFEKTAKGRAYGKVSDTLDDDPRNGWTTETGDATQPHTAVFELEKPLTVDPDEELIFVLLHRSTDGDSNIGRFRISLTDQRGETVKSLKKAPLEELAAHPAAQPSKIDPELRKRLLEQHLLDDTVHQAALGRLNEARRQLNGLKRDAGELNVMVLGEQEEPRTTYILERGVWDAHGKEVTPSVLPAVLEWPQKDTTSRLDLAKWLVSADNPLTARVVVNHLWQLVYGAGLVRTPEDFGLQGELPTHPELLDWLAVELIESGWDLRHVLRILATSDTFRQSSDIAPDLLERDPENRLLARASRQRMPAWMIRDSALAASGLLNPAIGGPPIKPWQPEGVWEEIFMGRFTYDPSLGPAQYRRTIYTYWRRSIAPTFLFDSAQRRVCEVGVRQTNTPLHALTLLNDTTMLEASRVLADQLMEMPGSDSERLQALSMQVLSRDLRSEELQVVEREWQRALAHFESHFDEAGMFTTIGQQKAPHPQLAPETAAWMTVASLLLNLDEAITHE